MVEGAEEYSFEKYLYSRNTHKEDLEEELRKLYKVILGSPASITIDAVGYGKYVDYMLMQKLLIGGGERCFTYSTSFAALE